MRRRLGELRIVGGDWRGRRLAFPELPGVRPSPVRLRETLFNWLAPLIAGARCLDLFAGSGALGLEALSRGAGEVVFVDCVGEVARAIEHHLSTLNASRRGHVVRADAMSYLRGHQERFDIVFLDPPFGEERLIPCLHALEGHLAPGHRVYVEYGCGEPVQWPRNATVLKQGRAGRVACALLRMDMG